LIGSPWQKRTVSGVTIQTSPGSIATTFVRNPALTINEAAAHQLRLGYLELDGTHATMNQENIAFMNRPVGLKKVRL
jgi:hypothetical protein